MKCKICGGQCGIVCRGFGFAQPVSKRAAEFRPARDERQPRVPDAVQRTGSANERASVTAEAKEKAKPVRVPPAKKGKGGRPRKGSEPMTNKGRKPWLDEKPPISERTWYRRQKEARDDV